MTIFTTSHCLSHTHARARTHFDTLTYFLNPRAHTILCYVLVDQDNNNTELTTHFGVNALMKVQVLNYPQQGKVRDPQVPCGCRSANLFLCMHAAGVRCSRADPCFPPLTCTGLLGGARQAVAKAKGAYYGSCSCCPISATASISPVLSSHGSKWTLSSKPADHKIWRKVLFLSRSCK